MAPLHPCRQPISRSPSTSIGQMCAENEVPALGLSSENRGHTDPQTVSKRKETPPPTGPPTTPSAPEQGQGEEQP